MLRCSKTFTLPKTSTCNSVLRLTTCSITLMGFDPRTILAVQTSAKTQLSSGGVNWSLECDSSFSHSLEVFLIYECGVRSLSGTHAALIIRQQRIAHTQLS